MKKILLFIIFTVICIISSKNLAQSKSGTFKTYYQNGKVKSDEIFKSGKKIGTCKYYTENGKLLYEENFNDYGLKEGITNAFYENGQLESSYNYRNGEMHGVFKEFYEDGKLKDEGKYEYGKRKYYSVVEDNRNITNNEVSINNSNEQMPLFKGGDTELMKFISNNLRYPIESAENGIQGRVIVRFIVDENGNVTNPQIVKGLDPACDREALRIIKMMPQWIAGKQGGENVSTEFALPILFRLSR